jgi:hypothetical protein
MIMSGSGALLKTLKEPVNSAAAPSPTVLFKEVELDLISACLQEITHELLRVWSGERLVVLL